MKRASSTGWFPLSAVVLSAVLCAPNAGRAERDSTNLLAFNSKLALDVLVRDDEGFFESIGITPAPMPLVIPAGRDWAVAPIEGVSAADVMAEANAQRIAGVLLREVSDADLAAITVWPASLRTFEVDCCESDAWMVHLKKLKRLRSLCLYKPGPTGLAYLKELKELRSLELTGVKAADIPLADLSSLRDLSLYDADVSDEGFAYFMVLKDLQRLDLHGVKDVGAGIARLKDLTSLRELNLESIRHITKAGFAALGELNEVQKISFSTYDFSSTVNLAHLKDVKGLWRIDFQSYPITDEDVGRLQVLTGLRELRLGGGEITDVGLAHLKGIKVQKLTLDLTGPKITDAGLAHLKGLDALDTLEFHQAAITDDGLANLEGLKALRQLVIPKMMVSDAGLAHLAGLKSLRELNLADTPITDAGLAHLAQLKGLESLELQNTVISDAGLVHLKNFKRLHYLGLSHTRITDAGLAHVKDLKALERVSLESTQVTATGLNDLRKALPNASISENK
ncbi:MAG: hypothetical protein NTV86_18880 [Planctomycetota bacterium]|nr:hypothetical protein [Planctomycetota bacterium]